MEEMKGRYKLTWDDSEYSSFKFEYLNLCENK